MRRRSKAGSKLAKARRGKLPARKRRNVSRTVRRPRSTGTGQDAKVTRLARELDEALEQQAAASEILQVISLTASEIFPPRMPCHRR
jgi:hypothetical protein